MGPRSSPPRRSSKDRRHLPQQTAPTSCFVGRPTPGSLQRRAQSVAPSAVATSSPAENPKPERHGRRKRVAAAFPGARSFAGVPSGSGEAGEREVGA